MLYTPVESHNINAIGYDPERKVMRLVFRAGYVMEYDVNPAQFAELVKDRGYLDKRKRSRFPTRMVADRKDDKLLFRMPKGDD